jgi:hypothetical protein
VLNSTLVSTVHAGLPPGSAPRAVALRGQRLVVAGSEGEAAVIDGATDWQPAGRLRLAHGPGPLSLTPSGRFLLARSPDRDRAAVHDLEAGAIVVDAHGAEGAAGSAVAALATTGGQELALVSTAPHELRAYSLPEGELLLQADARPFMFAHLVVVGAGDMIVALGHYPTEGFDSLVTFPLAALLADPLAAARIAAERPGIDDYAYTLAAGPCGRDELLVYRDPEDWEEIDPDEDPEDIPSDRRDVYGYRGLYLRRLADGALAARVPAALTATTGTELFATAASIVVGFPDRVEVFSREDAQAAPALYRGAARGLDPDAGRIAIARADSAVDLYEARYPSRS